MKNTTLIALAVLLAGCVFAQNLPSYPEWKATVRVLDEAGKPIGDADVSVWYYVTPTNGASEASARTTGRTDAGGMFSASGHGNSATLGFVAEKDGFYKTTRGYELGAPYQYDPVKWSPNLTLILKNVGHPIPMYAKRVNLGMPVFDKPVGFDLKVGDWVAPYGKGTGSDIIFTAHDEKRSMFDWDYKLVVSFPDSGGGIQEFTESDSEKGSSLMSSNQAPIDGYEAQWVQTRSARPHPGGYSGNWDQNRNYYFRTTLSDGVHYGKIYGDFLQFAYYLNPAPNDPNVEFDPGHNLVKLNWRWDLKVTAP